MPRSCTPVGVMSTFANYYAKPLARRRGYPVRQDISRTASFESGSVSTSQAAQGIIPAPQPNIVF